MAGQVVTFGQGSRQNVIGEIRAAFEDLGAEQALLDIIQRWEDGEDENKILTELVAFNGGAAEIADGGDIPTISSELYAALERLNASPELMALIGSWGDGEDDAELLKGLRLFNRTGSIFDSESERDWDEEGQD